MAQVVAEEGAGVFLMHMAGTPQTMQLRPAYSDVVREVKDFLTERVVWAEKQGIPREHMAIDPGIGFGKTTAHNLALLAHLDQFAGLGIPIWVGLSRKRFVGEVLGGKDAVLAPEERLEGSLAAALWAVSKGASGVRVHDVQATRRALTVWEALRETV